MSPEDWFAPYVEVCADEGLLLGGGDGTFRPQGRVNADEALVMAARILWQAQGNSLPLPKGLSAEEFTANLGQDFSYMTTLHGTWAWDGISYFWSEAARGEAKLPLPTSLQEPASRWEFFSWLAFAAGALDLTDINDIFALPDVEEQAILGLYRAGILTGTDGYGTFSGNRTLARAEAATLLARLARTELRLPFTPLPAPEKGYTLTRLADGTVSWGVTPWLCGMEDGFLTLTGELVPFPGNGPSSALSPAGDYFHIGVYVEETQDPYDIYSSLLGRDGRPVIPFGLYDDMFPAGEGFLAVNRQENGRDEYVLLHGDGSPALALPPLGAGMEPMSGWSGLSHGLLPCRDTATGLWGYVDKTGAWALEPRWTYATSFSGGYAVVGNDQDLRGAIDQSGTLALPLEYLFLETPYNSPGYTGESLFSAVDGEGNALWINLRGESRPRPDGGHQRYRNGYMELDEVYFDLAGNPVSEVFDWTGPMGADGVGFAGKNGGIYRIEFHT